LRDVLVEDVRNVDIILGSNLDENYGVGKSEHG
jgi:hypothetical protein